MSGLTQLGQLPFDRPSLHRAFRDGTPAGAVVEESLRRIEAARDPGIFLDLVPAETRHRDAQALPPFDPERFPLWGLPCAVKDNIDVAGRPTTAGCAAFARIAEQDAPCVASLRNAGALIVGKTNLDQFATGLVGTRTPFPVPRNAISPDRVPGGSSSGSAVAVARGLVAFALGTDTAGSGRVPAALNGIVGLKPSPGAVSTRGVVPACRSLDCVSVFAAGVEDAWAVFAAISGADPLDPYSRAVAPGRPGDAPALCRVAIPDEAALQILEPASRIAWQAALSLLPAEGMTAEPIDFRPFADAGRMLYESALVAERAASFGSAVPAQALHPVTRTILEGAARFTAADVFAAQHRLAGLRAQAIAVLENFDALLVPSVACFPTLAEMEADPFGPNARLGAFTNFVNLFELAAIAVPGPPRPDALPAGVTLIGRHGTDAALAATAARLHAASRSAARLAA
jgi:allophanate hydrolase